MAAQRWATSYSLLLDMVGSVDTDPKLMKIVLTYVDFAILPLKTRIICGPPAGTSMGSDLQLKNCVKKITAESRLINPLCGQSRN